MLSPMASTTMANAIETPTNDTARRRDPLGAAQTAATATSKVSQGRIVDALSSAETAFCALTRSGDRKITNDLSMSGMLSAKANPRSLSRSRTFATIGSSAMLTVPESSTTIAARASPVRSFTRASCACLLACTQSSSNCSEPSSDLTVWSMNDFACSVSTGASPPGARWAHSA
ncbi:hypothetical protein C7458_104417 [Williamsia muralis]|nr:hypothetical protein C7458_104417 [Williamsia marianensis]